VTVRATDDLRSSTGPRRLAPGLGRAPEAVATATRIARIAMARPGRRAGADAVGRIRCAVSAFARTFSGCVIS